MPLDSSLFWDYDTGCLKAALYIPGYKMDTPKNIKKNNIILYGMIWKHPVMKELKKIILAIVSVGGFLLALAILLNYMQGTI